MHAGLQSRSVGQLALKLKRTRLYRASNPSIGSLVGRPFDGLHEADGVVRKISWLVHADFEVVVARGIGLPLDPDGFNLHVPNAAPTREHDVGLVDVARRLAEEIHVQRQLLLIHDLDVVEAIEARHSDVLASVLVLAAEVVTLHGDVPDSALGAGHAHEVLGPGVAGPLDDVLHDDAQRGVFRGHLEGLQVD